MTEDVDRLRGARTRLRSHFFETATIAVAAALAWEIADVVAGHPRPVFATIAAIIAMTANAGRRGRQAIEVLVGTAIGIALGETVLWLAGGGGVWQLALGLLVGLSVATALDMPPTVIAQSAVWITLVSTLQGPQLETATARLEDAAIGAGVAFLFAQVLFPIDPIKLVTDAERALRHDLAAGLDDLAGALEQRDAAAAERALAGIEALDDRALQDALAIARDVVRRAPRRRPARRAVEGYGVAAHELTMALADAHSLGTGVLRVLRQGDEPPQPAVEAIRAIAAAWRTDDPSDATTLAEQAVALAFAATALNGSLGVQAVAHAVDALSTEVTRAAEGRQETSVSEPIPARILHPVSSFPRHRFRARRG